MRNSINRRQFIGQAGVFGITLPTILSGKPVFAADRRRWAVLVGVARYAPSANQTRSDNLHGPDNDVPAVRELLTGKYGIDSANIRTLQNEAATRQAILEAWDWLRARASAGDQVLFYFSGHGARVKRMADDPNPAPYTSALCPHDARQNGVIPGYEIGRRIDALPTENVVVIVDACSSGSATRSPLTRPRSMQLEKRDGFADPFAGAQIGTDSGEFAPGTTPQKQRERYLGASRIDQPAVDAALLPSHYDNPNMGAMTYFLLEELRADTKNRLTYRTLCNNVRERLVERFQEEASDPQISGPNIDSEPFLYLPERPTTVSAPIVAAAVALQKETVTLKPVAGSVLTPGSLLEARVSGQSRAWREDLPDNDRALVRITAVNGPQTTAKLLRGKTVAGEQFVELLHGASTSDKLTLFIGGKIADSVRTAINGIDGLRIAAKADGADISLLAESPDKVIVYQGVTPLLTVPLAEIPIQIRRLAAVHTLVGLNNRLEEVTISLLGNGKAVFLEAAIESRIAYELTVNRNGYVTIIGLAADGKITGMSDVRVQENIPLKFDVILKPPVGVDILKVVYTPRRLNLSLPENEAEYVKSGGDSRAIANRILKDLKTGINDASSRGVDFQGIREESEGIAVDGWATADFYLRIRDR